MATLIFKLNEHLYLRDPQHTSLGQKIIQVSVELIDRLGFEQFTFKKLAVEIGSTEASVYRYFENKHRLLHYLIAWYWSWIEYRIDFLTGTMKDPKEKLKAFIYLIAEEKKYDPNFEFVDEEALYRIVVSELDKTYLTRWVDDDNKVGLFGGFKSLCKKIAVWVNEVNPDYPYPNSLVSTLLLASNQQIFFAEHLPSLSNIKKNKSTHNQLAHFLQTTLFNTIR